MDNFEKQFLLPYLVKPHDVIKSPNIQKLCISTLALLCTTSNEKFSLVYLIRFNLFKDHFWLRDFGSLHSPPCQIICKFVLDLINFQATGGLYNYLCLFSYQIFTLYIVELRITQKHDFLLLLLAFFRTVWMCSVMFLSLSVNSVHFLVATVES